jgi:hypothetical protein
MNNKPPTWLSWTFPDSQLSSLQIGDEIAVYSDRFGLQHRGLIYRFPTDPRLPVAVAHFDKENNITLTALEDFGEIIFRRRRPDSPEHGRMIIERATAALNSGAEYNALFANCEHFTEYCYSGEPNSPTVIGLAVLGLLAVLVTSR